MRCDDLAPIAYAVGALLLCYIDIFLKSSNLKPEPHKQGGNHENSRRVFDSVACSRRHRSLFYA